MRVKTRLHNYFTFHYYDITWYTGPGYEKYNGIWKIQCQNCTKLFYLDKKIDSIIETHKVMNTARDLENEAVKSRMN